ncbi:tetratricopeptide repeat protein [Stieleria neptunia]|nr:tetratricopeptide repeat protein [Stieleria neptunia]
MKTLPTIVLCLAVSFMVLGCGSGIDSAKAATEFNTANSLRETDKPKAIEHYGAAIQADPSMDEAYFNRALTYAEIGEVAKAESDLQSLRDLKSEHAETLDGLLSVVRQ